MVAPRAARDRGGTSFDLAGQVAWVTGGGTGLGRGAAEALAQHGATVVVSGRRPEPLEEAVQVIRSAGGVAHSLVCDVARTGDVRASAASLGDRFGRLDILVTSAGINRRGPALEYAEEAWDEVFATNLKGCFFTCQAAARLMRGQGGGKIITIGSLSSERGVPNISAYATSKGAIRSLTKSLAVEWAPLRINVNAIIPGYFHTELTDPVFRQPEWRERALARIPWGRTGEASDLAGTVLFLASPASDYVTGILVHVDGGAYAG